MRIQDTVWTHSCFFKVKISVVIHKHSPMFYTDPNLLKPCTVGTKLQIKNKSVTSAPSPLNWSSLTRMGTQDHRLGMLMPVSIYRLSCLRKLWIRSIRSISALQSKSPVKDLGRFQVKIFRWREPRLEHHPRTIMCLLNPPNDQRMQVSGVHIHRVWNHIRIQKWKKVQDSTIQIQWSDPRRLRWIILLSKAFQIHRVHKLYKTNQINKRNSPKSYPVLNLRILSINILWNMLIKSHQDLRNQKIQRSMSLAKGHHRKIIAELI